MGCTTTTPEARKMLRVPTLFGALHIKVTNAHLDYNPNSVMTMDPYIKIIISNQNRVTQVKKKGGNDPRFDEDFIFSINSCYKPYGRSLQLFVLDKQMIGSDSLVGYGLLDLDFLIKNNKDTIDMKLRLNYKCKQIGWANLKIRFEELPIESINFRFQSLDIIKSSFQGAKECFVKMTFGQQVFQTPKVKDTPQNPPLWNDQAYQIEVPSCVTTAIFEVLDDKKLIGKAEVEMSRFTKITQQISCKQQIKDEDGVVTGTLKFSVLRGANVDMAPDQTVYKKGQIKEPMKQEKPSKRQEPPHQLESEKQQTKQIPKEQAPKTEQKEQQVEGKEPKS